MILWNNIYERMFENNFHRKFRPNQEEYGFCVFL